MKRILKLGMVLFALIFLVSCMDNFKEVKLSYDEAKAELSNVEVAKKDTLELNLDLNMKSSDSDDFIDLKANALLNNNQIVLDTNLDATFLEANIKGDGLFYLVNEGLFIDGNLTVKQGEDNEVSIKGKKRLTEFEGALDGFVDIEGFLDLDLDELINDPEFKRFVEEYEGLTFYKDKDDLKIRFEINEELVKEHKDLFETDSFLNIDEDINMVLEVIIRDKKLTNFSLDLNINNDDFNLTLKVNAKLTNNKINLPDFSEFKDVEF